MKFNRIPLDLSVCTHWRKQGNVIIKTIFDYRDNRVYYELQSFIETVPLNCLDSFVVALHCVRYSPVFINS